MNLNGNSRFSLAPRSEIQRSVFDRSFSHKTTFNAGDLVPVYFEDVLPGDTVSLDLSSICRMTTPLYPVMDNSWLDFHFFFVPMRLVWEHSKEFFGESQEAWDDETEYEIPHTSFTVNPGTFFDYIGVNPQGPVDVSTLPWRAYCLIWNEWYRDQNLQDPLLVSRGDLGDSAGNSALPSKMNSSLLKVNKYKDYFTSCLPSPQKGADVSIGLGEFAPVKTREQRAYTLTELAGVGLQLGAAGVTPGLSLPSGHLTTTSGVVFSNTDVSDVNAFQALTPLNLWADLSGAVAPSINDLRHAFAIQRLLELDARSGSRYRELVKAHFGVDTGDARVQVPEYLGGKHISINVSQVIQQSNVSDAPTPLGNTGAFSKTVDRGSIFTKSFTEHGFLMGFCSVRTDHTYQQGVPRSLMRRNRYDFYWPELAHIGEQPVKVSEIYADADPTNELVFGYQEAWADYRYSPNRVSATFRSNAPGSLDVWHYADDYGSRPYLSDGWIAETSANIARTLAVQDTGTSDQFLLDCYFKASWARPMPVYSIPGLGGHF